jgi:hypothetical protein
MVTLDPVARSMLAVSETVNVLGAPDIGVLCRIDLTVNCGVCAPTATILLVNPIKKSTLSYFRKLFRFFEDVWSIRLSNRK